MAPSMVLKGTFVYISSNAVFSKYLGSWKESWQGSWKELKMNLFGNNFWTTGGRGLKFCRMVCAYCEQLLAKFQVTASNSLRVIAVFVIWRFWPIFAHAQCQWSLGVPWVGFGSKLWISMVDATFSGKQAKWHLKTLELFQKHSGLERNLFWHDWDKLSLILINLI